MPEGITGEIESPSIVTVDYDPGWPERFRQEEARIRLSLREAALSVEHIGSTSVPGLAAKPIVDVLLVVEDPGDEPCYVTTCGKTKRIGSSTPGRKRELASRD